MVGGTIVQKIGNRIEVLESQYFDRRWRQLSKPECVEVGDEIWWQNFVGYATRRGEFRDKNIGDCRAANAPTESERGQ